MTNFEEEFDRLERKVKFLEEEFGTFLTTLTLVPKDRFDIIQQAALMALENLKAYV